MARSALVAWDYYQLKDEAQQLITFGAGTSTTDLHNRILIRAEELEVPLEPANLDVSRDGGRTYVQAFYTQPVEVFPSYFYPVGSFLRRRRIRRRHHEIGRLVRL